MADRDRVQELPPRVRRTISDSPQLRICYLSTLDHLDELTKIVEAEGTDITHIRNIVTTMKAESEKVAIIDANTALSLSWGQSSLLPAKVFNIPELLEHILSFLPNPVLFRVQGVSQNFYKCINDSISLQRKLGLKPDPGSYLRFPFVDPLRQWHYYVDRHPNASATAGKDGPTLALTFEHFDDTLYDVGSNVRSSLICQPPLLSVQAFARCCGPHLPVDATTAKPGAIKPFTSKDGLRFGDILDAYRSMKQEHRLCPHAALYQHDDDGKVDPKIVFMATVPVSETDPLYVEYLERKAGEKQRDATEQRLQQYIAAKTNGE